jgi:hypothetical protein
MLPLWEGVGLEKIEEPASIADVAMAVLQNEIDRHFLRPLSLAGEVQFRGDIGGRKSKAGPKAHAILAIEPRSRWPRSVDVNLSAVAISDDDRESQPENIWRTWRPRKLPLDGVQTRKRRCSALWLAY